jgi:hypothetical protein
MTTTHRITTTAAVILSLAAAGAPPASARPADYVPVGKQAPTSLHSRPGKTTIPTSWPYPYGGNPKPATAAPAAVPQAVVRIQTPPSGFDWGDAGIGAAGGLAVAMLGLGAGLVISHQRPRRARPTTTLPN